MGPESTGAGGSTAGPERTIPAKVVVMKVSSKNAECFTNSREPGPATRRLAETRLEGANGGTARTDSDIGRLFDIRGQSVDPSSTTLASPGCAQICRLRNLI